MIRDIQTDMEKDKVRLLNNHTNKKTDRLKDALIADRPTKGQIKRQMSGERAHGCTD